MEECRGLEVYNSLELSDQRWNKEETNHLLMHSIHVYPAKFPPMIAEEAFVYAEEEGVRYSSVADLFCGCGTVALESIKRKVSFWGCDINPVAVLIAKAKTSQYDVYRLETYYEKVMLKYEELRMEGSYDNCYEYALDRLKYWYSEEAYRQLYILKMAIEQVVRIDPYLTGFQCLFSSILKSSSKWLQKSIKPQVDPNKKEMNIEKLFFVQFNRFVKAVEQINQLNISRTHGSIRYGDILKIRKKKKVDLIITSPPYVTSYEYADLHQLSSLWLGYTSDYRELRKDSIGSSYNNGDIDINSLILNTTGAEIVEKLKYNGIQRARINAIAKYYSDMERVMRKCSGMLNKNGMALFVIGDSELRGVKLQNSKHLIESMQRYGFRNIKIGKRTIEKSMCVPYRDVGGRFTKKDVSKNKIYQEEYVISGRIV